MNQSGLDAPCCKVCGALMQPVFRAVLLGRHEVGYAHCALCGLLTTETPYWLDEAYSEAIAATDVGLVERNQVMSSRIAASLCFALNLGADERVLDVAGGYGLLVRMLRDYGIDCFWQDKYCQNIFAQSFEWPEPPSVPAKAVTAIEVMEHLENPLEFIRDVMKQTGARSFLFTTELYEGAPPDPDAWWYYSRETGQHISFYTRKTLETMAAALDMSFMTCRGLHMFSKDSVSPWVFRLAAGRFHPVASRIVRKRLGSRIPADHAQAIKRLGQAERVGEGHAEDA
jgi:hypothetical protein